MQRRSFLTAAGAMALAPLTQAMAQGPAIPAAKLTRLSISSSSYRGNYEGRFNVPTATPKLSLSRRLAAAKISKPWSQHGTSACGVAPANST